ncbi:putative Pre-rRNA-processing protein [Seiridium cardinale]|uniref:Pre-rRNA-processing protein n=1 Tax=Seiridium cardinale TaxID=138064 RepID=A0ABR2XR91_9PEZI
MGSSTRKKKEKKKDFQKPKLKVGKAKAKPANFTDTSFKSKAIVLHEQLKEDAPDVLERFKHHLSLLTSKTDSQRRDALAYLTGQLSTNPPFNPVGTPTLLMKLLPLMIDASGSVRNQLIKLLRAIPAPEVRSEVEKIMRYIRGAMTHISQEIKDDGLNYMEWLLDVAGDQVVESAGCWVKPLKDFTSILGWTTYVKAKTTTPVPGKGGWTSAPRTTFGAKKYGASYPRQMSVVAKFLECGFKKPEPTPWDAGQWFSNFTHLPTTPDPYGYIGLFAPPRDEDGRMYRDRDERQAIFQKNFYDAYSKGVEDAKKEGGMAGRAAAQLDKALKEGMSDYEDTKRYNEDDGLWDGYIM